MLPVQEAIVDVIAQHQPVIAKVVQSLNRSEISVGLKRFSFHPAHAVHIIMYKAVFKQTATSVQIVFRKYPCHWTVLPFHLRIATRLKQG